MIGGMGSPQTKSLLNKTLLYIISLLKLYEVTDWFLGYGTLLGIVRNNSCSYETYHLSLCRYFTFRFQCANVYA